VPRLRRPVHAESVESEGLLGPLPDEALEGGVIVTVTVDLNGVSVPVTFDDVALAAIAAALPRETTDLESPYLTIPEACEYARMSRQRIYDLRSSGRLSRSGDGSSARVLRAELDALISNGDGARR
jgi:excisionase family DNA binding protein